jgi:hypothetical protein
VIVPFCRSHETVWTTEANAQRTHLRRPRLVGTRDIGLGNHRLPSLLPTITDLETIQKKKVVEKKRHAQNCSCDGWVCGLGAVGACLVFGLVRGAGAFAVVLPSVVLFSRIQLAQRYRGNIATSFTTLPLPLLTLLP